MSTETKLSIAELLLSEQRMTPRGPLWKRDTGVYGDPDGDDDLAFARGPMVKRKSGDKWGGEWMKQAEADSDGITAFRNAAPVLLEIVAAALAWRDSREASSEKRTAAHYRLIDALAKVRP